MWNTDLASAEFLVCKDIFPNETTRFAHVVLPAAAWSENDGTFTNSERRVSRVRTASRRAGPGQAQLVDLQGDRRGAWARSGRPDSAREIWDNEISVLAPQMCGIKYHRMEGDGLQWPVPAPGPSRHAVPAPGRPVHLRAGHLHPGRVDAAGRSAGRGVSPGAQHRPPALPIITPAPRPAAAKASTISARGNRRHLPGRRRQPGHLATAR